MLPIRLRRYVCSLLTAQGCVQDPYSMIFQLENDLDAQTVLGRGYFNISTHYPSQAQSLVTVHLFPSLVSLIYSCCNQLLS